MRGSSRQASGRRGSGWRQHSGPDSGFRGESRWREWGVDGSQWTISGKSHSSSFGQWGARAIPSELYRGPWHRYATWRSDRDARLGAGFCQRPLPRSALGGWFREDQYWPLRGSRRDRKSYKSRARAPASGDSAASTFQATEPAHRLGGPAGAGADGADAVAGLWGAAPGGGQCVWHERDERARDCRGGAAARTGDTRGGAGLAGVDAVGEDGGGPNPTRGAVCAASGGRADGGVG